jgi:hypothetical protein
MTTMLEECNTEEQHSVVCVVFFFFGGEKRVAAKDIHKEVSCLQWEVFITVHDWVEKFSEECYFLVVICYCIVFDLSYIMYNDPWR